MNSARPPSTQSATFTEHCDPACAPAPFRSERPSTAKLLGKAAPARKSDTLEGLSDGVRLRASVTRAAGRAVDHAGAAHAWRGDGARVRQRAAVLARTLSPDDRGGRRRHLHVGPGWHVPG